MVFLDQNNSAQGTLYMDDGISFEYENNNFLYMSYEFKDNILTSKIESKDTSKTYFEEVKNAYKFMENIYIYGISIETLQKLNCISLSYDEKDGYKTSDMIIKYEFTELVLTITDIYIPVDTEFKIQLNF